MCADIHPSLLCGAVCYVCYKFFVPSGYCVSVIEELFLGCAVLMFAKCLEFL